ncbi:MAG TPA: hypothetical protein VJN71_05515 [Nitrososphaerales archaeon]|nr:hypothetical protein [Nitrososphaerales archaeon]
MKNRIIRSLLSFYAEIPVAPSEGSGKFYFPAQMIVVTSYEGLSATLENL